MVLVEQTLIYAINVDGDSKNKQVISVKNAASFDLTAEKTDKGIYWEVKAVRSGKEEKTENEDNAAPVWDVAKQLILIDDCDFAMISKAMRKYRSFGSALLKFEKSDKLEDFQKSLDEFVAANFASKEDFEKAKYELYYCNDENAVVPTIARVDSDESATFWVFKTGFVEI